MANTGRGRNKRKSRKQQSRMGGAGQAAMNAQRAGFRGISAFGGKHSGGNIGDPASPSYGQGTESQMAAARSHLAQHGTAAQKAAVAKYQKGEEAKTKVGSITSSYNTKFADYSKAFEPGGLTAEKPNALTQIGKALRYTNPLTGFALQGIGSMMSPRQNANLSISNAFSPSMTSKDTFGITSGMGINADTASQYSKAFTTPYQGLAGPPSLGERAKDAALGALDKINPISQQWGVFNQLDRLRAVQTPWAPVNRTLDAIGQIGTLGAGLTQNVETQALNTLAQAVPNRFLPSSHEPRMMTRFQNELQNRLGTYTDKLSPSQLNSLSNQVGDFGDIHTRADYTRDIHTDPADLNTAWGSIQQDPNFSVNVGPLKYNPMRMQAHQLGADATVNTDDQGITSATEGFRFTDPSDMSVPLAQPFLAGAYNLARKVGEITGAQSEANPGYDASMWSGEGAVTTPQTLNIRKETPSISRDFATLAGLSNDPSSSLYSPTRDTFTRGLGTDTKALRRNQFSSSPNSNLDRSLAQVSGALKSTSDQVAQQANLGISGYLSQANEQRAAAQKHLATIQGGRTDLAAEIAKLKEGYSDVDVDTKGLEELEGQYGQRETDITKQLSDYDQNVRGYVTQWQQSTQTPQWTMGVKAKGNIYKSPLQQFGRKARTTSKKIQTPGSEFTIGGLASAWNPTLNI